MIWQAIVIVFAALLLLEGLLILALPKQTLRLVRKLLKKEDQLKFIGIVEALICLILLVLVLIY